MSLYLRLTRRLKHGRTHKTSLRGVAEYTVSDEALFRSLTMQRIESGMVFETSAFAGAMRSLNEYREFASLQSSGKSNPKTNQRYIWWQTAR
jgi:D-serine dehydratase